MNHPGNKNIVTPRCGLCENAMHARGMCKAHYAIWLTANGPLHPRSDHEGTVHANCGGSLIPVEPPGQGVPIGMNYHRCVECGMPGVPAVLAQ